MRLLVALLLTAPGLVPIPYIGWAPGLVFLGPATALLVIAATDRQSRRIVLLWSIPTGIGIALCLFSLVVYRSLGSGDHLILQIFGVAAVTTLLATLLGRPPSTP